MIARKIEQPKSSYRTSHRSIVERWVITGKLILETPAHFGGEGGINLMDMPVFINEIDGTPLLPGTSIAGALRSYIRALENGDGVPYPFQLTSDDDDNFQKQQELEKSFSSSILFGDYRGDKEGMQSPLIVFDATGIASGWELRDGVSIDSKTRTASEEKKFDIQLLAAGSSFDLRFELIISNSNLIADLDEYRDKLLAALGSALNGLEEGHITLGSRKSRGYGKCSARSWKIYHYDMRETNGLLAWLASDRQWQSQDDTFDWMSEFDTHSSDSLKESDSILQLLRSVGIQKKRRNNVRLTAEFLLSTPMLIRSGLGESDIGADVVHIHSLRSSKGLVPVIPGTSWAGILRQRASKIARTVSGNSKEKVIPFIDEIFGDSGIAKKNIKASRLSINESEIIETRLMGITRVKIDRLTGGTFESALFSEMPVVNTDHTSTTLELILRSKSPATSLDASPEIDEAEIGLLLLLVKDLWTGDLQVGGGVGIGRGILRGIKCTLTIADKQWIIKQEIGTNELLISGNQEELESFVVAFSDRMAKNG